LMRTTRRSLFLLEVRSCGGPREPRFGKPTCQVTVEAIDSVHLVKVEPVYRLLLSAKPRKHKMRGGCHLILTTSTICVGAAATAQMRVMKCTPRRVGLSLVNESVCGISERRNFRASCPRRRRTSQPSTTRIAVKATPRWSRRTRRPPCRANTTTSRHQSLMTVTAQSGMNRRRKSVHRLIETMMTALDGL
jgi:hypothetical protein